MVNSIETGGNRSWIMREMIIDKFLGSPCSTWKLPKLNEQTKTIMLVLLP
jgi:hypothetical protein